MDGQILLKIKPKVNAKIVLIRDDHYFINKYPSNGYIKQHIYVNNFSFDV